MKNSILSGCLVVLLAQTANGAPSLNQLMTKISNMEQVISLQQLQLKDARPSYFSVGSIQQSILSAEEFAGVAGQDWVAMEGQSLTECANLRRLCQSKLAEILLKRGKTHLPDARGRFLRTTGGEAAHLGDAQGFATSAAGLVVSTSGSVSIQAAGGTRGFT